MDMKEEKNIYLVSIVNENQGKHLIWAENESTARTNLAEQEEIQLRPENLNPAGITSIENMKYAQCKLLIMDMDYSIIKSTTDYIEITYKNKNYFLVKNRIIKLSI